MDIQTRIISFRVLHLGNLKYSFSAVARFVITGFRLLPYFVLSCYI